MASIFRHSTLWHRRQAVLYSPTMDLLDYFSSLLSRVEASPEIQNNGKDDNGFYLPTRTLLLRHLNLLKDLHAKPGAQAMVRDSWSFVVQHLPPEWLVLSETQRLEMKRILR